MIRPLTKSAHILLSLSCIGYLFLFSFEQNSWADPVPLDKEVVFCIYHALSGEDMKEQDLEDLSFGLGRPTFTSYKPSEMFTKDSLKALKMRLLEKVRKVNETDLFQWTVECSVILEDQTKKRPNIHFDYKKIPHPTEYIHSEISKKDLGKIRKGIVSFICNQSNTAKNTFDIIILLRPKKIVYRYEKRNVARDNIVLPIRSVIFQPVKIKIFDETIVM